jgi:hypothetical protein
VVAVIVVDVQEAVHVNAALESILIRAAVEQVADGPVGPLERDIRVFGDGPLAHEDGIGRRDDDAVIMRRGDRPLAGAHLSGEELVERQPAAGSLEIVVHVVIGQGCERLDPCRGRRRVKECAPCADEILKPAIELVVVVELVLRGLVNDVVQSQCFRNDFPFRRYPGDEVVKVSCERLDVVDALHPRRFDCCGHRLVQVRTPFEKGQELVDDRFVLARRCRGSGRTKYDEQAGQERGGPGGHGSPVDACECHGVLRSGEPATQAV